MLRRSSCRLVASPSTPVTVHVRPPNPATAATWILLLLSVSTAAGWWIPLQLERTGGSPLDAIEALHLAGVGGLAWVAAFLLCAIGLTSWTVREARHRLRGQATDAMRAHARPTSLARPGHYLSSGSMGGARLDSEIAVALPR